MRAVVALAVTLLATASPLAAQTVAITNGTLVLGDGSDPIPGGTVVIRGGRVVAAGHGVRVPSNGEVIDANGKWVTPGLVDAATVLGVSEIGAVPGTNDANAEGHDNVAAAFRVADGLNPTSVLLSPTREDGITTVVIHPGDGLFDVTVVGATSRLELMRTKPRLMAGTHVEHPMVSVHRAARVI